jgi:excisionase family DNA binding protein
MKMYSTRQAARKLGIGQPALYRWMRDGRVRAPRKRSLGGISIRLWSARDLARVRRYMERHYREYRKGMGRRQKLKLR